nr:MAG TPA: hypothetical protein [Caudoviricetes sp.]
MGQQCYLHKTEGSIFLPLCHCRFKTKLLQFE